MITGWYCDDCGRCLHDYEIGRRSDRWPICILHERELECPDPDGVDESDDNYED